MNKYYVNINNERTLEVFANTKDEAIEKVNKTIAEDYKVKKDVNEQIAFEFLHDKTVKTQYTVWARDVTMTLDGAYQPIDECLKICNTYVNANLFFNFIKEESHKSVVENINKMHMGRYRHIRLYFEQLDLSGGLVDFDLVKHFYIRINEEN